MAVKRTKLQERYELRDVLGRGGMGVVYKALDTLMKREVALKTILDIDNPALAELFYKEWSILATMVHPNVIGIYDIGEFEEEGIKKPFFVMPLLPGVALDKLIRDGSPRLTTENVVNIIDQACRGLHASHEQGLVHRDVKPSNIFVMDDDSVKIIDFGIARVSSTSSKTGIKGTLFYLAPEFLEMKPPTALSDQFALAVSAYEALTRRRPFDGASDAEVFEAIRKISPPPVSELNPNVNYAISQVIHKAMAKQPYHRFLTIREFGDALQKARRNEPLELFDNAKIKPRLERARLSFEQGDYNFALEVLTELEAEGRLDPEVGLLRRQVDQAARHTRIKQSLEGARRFLEAAEYPLALRKIQDALDLDPGDTDALSLKAQVERERWDKKIEEWIQIARQHLDHQAFSQARDALNNVLKLKPNDTIALALMAEVGRRERDASQVREEKARLYQAAMQAWDKGEVTSALSKLEHLMKLDNSQPEADAGRTGTYHSFYNQVHSEHNSIRNAYEEARRNLATENYEAALATCRQYLSRYPNHALFQALKFDIEERQRQALSAVIANTDRRAEEEADLHKRVGILEEALKLYPGEQHFERALKLVRDKRDLVNSIVSKARYFEERGQFNEALDQWQILRSIYERYPGLAFEIERLMKKRDQQARENSKAMWVQQTDRCLEAGDYEGAVRSVESALAEFPAEPDLLELGNLAHNRRARAGEALQLLARARELSERGALEESLDPLRQAAKLDPSNTVIRTVLVNSLLDDARGLMQKPDWEAAEARLKELLALDPSHAGAASLASQIGDRKHEEFVSLCITQARRLQAEGDLARASAVVAQGLQAYPNDSRFEQLQATLQRAQSEAQGQPAEFRETPKAGAPAKASRSNAVTPQPPAPAAPPAASALSATLVVGRAPAQSAPPAKAIPSGPRTPAPPAAPPPATGKPAPDLMTRVLASKNLLYATAGLAAVVLLMVGGVVIARLRHHPPPPVAVATYTVLLRSSPEGAAISLDGKPCGSSTCQLQLPPGDHKAEATFNGYRDAAVPFTVTAGQSAPEVLLSLEALPAQVTLSTDLTNGTLSVDGGPAAQIQAGEKEIPNLSPGQHKLEVQGGGAKASLSFEFPPTALPKLTEPIQAQGINAVVISRYGSQAMVYCSNPGVAVTLDTKLAGPAVATGLELKDLTPGQHEVQVTINGLTQKIPFESSATPGISAYLLTQRNVGALRIITDDGATVYLNTQKNTLPIVRGRLMLYLPPKQYTVRVEKPGLWAADQTVNVRRGDETQLTFKLIPAKATLEVHGAPAGTEVLVDGTQIGSVGDSGFFSTNIEPGKHTVALNNERFRTSQAEYVFEPGKSITMEGATMQSATGTLKIDVSPPVDGLQLRFVREGDTREQATTEKALSLPEGTYRVTGSAPQYQDASETVRLTAGGEATVKLTMRRVGTTSSQPTAQTAFSIEEWAKASGANPSLSNWAREGKLWVKRGGEFVVPPFRPVSGTYIFTVILMKGKRLEWVVNYKDEKNYDLFQFDDKNLVRTQFLNGKKAESVKKPLSMKTGDYLTVMIAVTSNSIVHSFFVQQQWQVVDKWETPGGGLQGKVGFHVPGKDQIGVSDFRFLAN